MLVKVLRVPTRAQSSMESYQRVGCLPDPEEGMSAGTRQDDNRVRLVILDLVTAYQLLSYASSWTKYRLHLAMAR